MVTVYDCSSPTINPLVLSITYELGTGPLSVLIGQIVTPSYCGFYSSSIGWMVPSDMNFVTTDNVNIYVNSADEFVKGNYTLTLWRTIKNQVTYTYNVDLIVLLTNTRPYYEKELID